MRLRALAAAGTGILLASGIAAAVAASSGGVLASPTSPAPRPQTIGTVAASQQKGSVDSGGNVQSGADVQSGPNVRGGAPDATEGHPNHKDAEADG